MSQRIEKWMSELRNRAESTKKKYTTVMKSFCEWTGKDAEQIYQERKQDLKSGEIEERMRYERELVHFIEYLKREKNYSTASQQIFWAGVKSFFDVAYLPLSTRKNDYPSGQAIGHRSITKTELRKLVQLKTMSLRSKAIIYCLKDSGLRVSDLIRLRYGDIKKELEKGETVLSIKILTQKSKVLAKTYFGEETTNLLKEYFEARKMGTRRIQGENISENSPLIRRRDNFKPMSRTGVCSLVAMYIGKIGFSGELSAHSLRKYTQTQLEVAGLRMNWTKQILGHRLSGVEGSYSRPSDTMLREAYEKAYDKLRIFPRVLTTADINDIKAENQRLKQQVTSLEARQDKINGDREVMYQEFMKRLKKELGIEKKA